MEVCGCRKVPRRANVSLFFKKKATRKERVKGEEKQTRASECGERASTERQTDKIYIK